MRRPGWIAPALLLAGCAAPAPGPPARGPARPARVMSVNLCTDQLLLQLLPARRIASVSWLAREPSGSLMAAAAAHVPVNHGQAEDVLSQRPDLVVAGAFTTPALKLMLRRLGHPLLEVDEAMSIADVRRVTRQVAAAVGEKARGEALVARMDRTLAELARRPGPPVPVVAWDRSGFAAGQGTLYDAVLTAAGARNMTREPLALRYRRPDVEVLLAANPALLVQGSPDREGASLGDAVTRHRLVRRYWGRRTLYLPQAYYACGTPALADAAVRLRGELRAAQRRAGPVPAVERAS